MIGTIRKHSAWLWMVIIVATIISFLWWGASPATRGGGGSAGGLGTLYGAPITPQNYRDAANEFRLYYFTQTGSWPDQKGKISKVDMEQGTYIRMMMIRKAAQMHVQVGEDAVVAAANHLLSSPGMLRLFRTSSKTIPMDQFVSNVLAQEGLSAEDFERFIHNDIAISQLQSVFGAPGQIISPQEAEMFYDRENQEVSAQIVLFSASNYISQVTPTPEAIGQFYTNNMAAYRLPDRVQVKYVEFSVSNYMAQATTELSTNLDAQVGSIFNQYGVSGIPGVKTEAEAKAKIRDSLIRQRAAGLARLQATDFESGIAAMDPNAVKPDYLDQVAQKKGVTVKLTAPFGSEYGPEEFFAPEELTKAAFQLNADAPISSPIAGADGYYIIALAKQLPSVIPSFEQIQIEVKRDFQYHTAAVLARVAGTNFVQAQLPLQMAVGKKFAAAATASGLTPEVLPAFSISSDSVTGFEQKDYLNLLKRVAFGTAPGKASPFVATPEGGFVLYVDSLLPVDEAKKKADLADFTAELRHKRATEAFNEWLNIEANRELKNTAFFRDQALARSGGAPSQ